MVSLVLATGNLVWVSGVQAQQITTTDTQTLVSGWFDSPPLFEYGENGELSGFGTELAKLLARELDLTLQLRHSISLADDRQAFINGEMDIIPGAPSRPLSFVTMIQSISVAESRMRLIVRADRLDEIKLDAVSPPTVGYVEAGKELVKDALPSHLSLRPYDSPDDGLLALLSKEIDLWYSTEEGTAGWAYKAGIDHMLVPFGEPYTTDVRVVGIHESRPELLGPINEAIKRLEESGELAALRQHYHLQLYDPAPEVLRVGIAHYPPYQYVGPDGTFSGFSVEVFRDLAKRSGLKYEMQEISVQQLRIGLDWSSYDVLALFGNLKSRRDSADFTVPINDIEHSIFTTSKNTGRFNTLEDLVVSTVGVVTKSAGRRIADNHGKLNLVYVSRQKDLVGLLLDGRVDAVLTEKLGFESQLSALSLFDNIKAVEKPVYVAKGAIALRFGLGEVRERLNSAIPGYLLSADYAARRHDLKGEAAFWTLSRQRFALAGAVALTMLLLVMVVVLVMNLRARRLAEALTAKTLDMSGRLNAVMSAARSGIVGLDANGQVAFANPSACRMLGKSQAAVPYAWPKNVCFFDESGERVLVSDVGLDLRSVRDEELQGELLRMSNLAGGEPLHIRLSSSAIAADRSSEISTVLVLDDVTEEERHREQAERSSKLGAIGQLTGGIAHDFNNLLAVTLGNLELIKAEKSKEKIEHLADRAIEASLRGADLTRNMLAFARKSRLSPEVLDLNKVVVETKNWIGRTLPETVRVDTCLRADLWKVSADRNSTESALLNLIVNARDAMSGRGCLTLETTNCHIGESCLDTRDEELAPGRYVMLAISDTGQGIASDNLEQIFVPFYTTKELGHGTGLGLSMVMGFMRQSGGTVRVVSQPGQGATFKLYFPATEEPVFYERRKRQLAAPSGVGRRVLLAEDERAVREVLENILELAGYHVEAVASGDEAFARLKVAPRFDLLLTDIVMPGDLQGTDLVEAARKIQPALPVVFMSGYADDAAMQGKELTSNDTRLMKPVQRADLLSAMNKAISKRSRRASDRFIAAQKESS